MNSSIYRGKVSKSKGVDKFIKTQAEGRAERKKENELGKARGRKTQEERRGKARRKKSKRNDLEEGGLERKKEGRKNRKKDR